MKNGNPDTGATPASAISLSPVQHFIPLFSLAISRLPKEPGGFRCQSEPLLTSVAFVLLNLAHLRLFR
jgi:hypothetical protein